MGAHAQRRRAGRRTSANRGRESRDKKLAAPAERAPEIAFAWLIAVGVTDRHAYTGDSLNRRLLRAKLVYAVEETCEIR
jgi:hypothetical protein